MEIKKLKSIVKSLAKAIKKHDYDEALILVGMLEQYIKDEGSSPSMLKRAVVGHFPLVEIPIAPMASSFIGIKSLLSKEIASSFSNKSYLYVKKRNRNYSKKLQIIEKNLAKVEIDGKIRKY